jgi:hypothetical protein
MRVCNDKGCSRWSAPVLVRGSLQQQAPLQWRPTRFLTIVIVALLGVLILLLCIRKFEK